MRHTTHARPTRAALNTLEQMKVSDLLQGNMPYAPPHCQQWPWRPVAVPDGLPMQQSWGWLFVPDGRCVVLIDTEDWHPLLPGGTIEQAADDGDPAAALKREAAEEAQLALADCRHLGYVYDAEGAVYGGIGPCARIRMAARVTRIGPAAPDPASGQLLLRLLAPAHQTVDLFGWGEHAHRQAEAAEHTAREQWGLRFAPSPGISEIPAGGMLL